RRSPPHAPNAGPGEPAEAEAEMATLLARWRGRRYCAGLCGAYRAAPGRDCAAQNVGAWDLGLDGAGPAFHAGSRDARRRDRGARKAAAAALHPGDTAEGPNEDRRLRLQLFLLG